MNVGVYQRKAARTINRRLEEFEIELHAVHGLASEVGEIHGIYQKEYQGHPIDDDHLKKELGDLMWFVAELCTIKGWNLSEVMEMNIEKLKARYPDVLKEREELRNPLFTYYRERDTRFIRRHQNSKRNR